MAMRLFLVITAYAPSELRVPQKCLTSRSFHSLIYQSQVHTRLNLNQLAEIHWCHANIEIMLGINADAKGYFNHAHYIPPKADNEFVKILTRFRARLRTENSADKCNAFSSKAHLLANRVMIFSTSLHCKRVMRRPRD